MSFADLQTAVRVREIIKRQAVGQIDKNVQRPLIGRVVSVDLPRQTARVWFTGDDQPIEVSLFSSTIPGKWQSQLQPGMTASTNTIGYGSMVSCQRLNGILYITDVLSGGQFTYDLNTMNQKYIATYPFSGSAQSVFGQVVAAKMDVTIVTDLNLGESVEFGPFIMTGDPKSSNWVRIQVNNSTGCASYEFNMAQGQLWSGTSSLNRWYRILPKQETSTYNQNEVDYFDLDICMKHTQYGIEPEFNVQSDEFWFRLIPRYTGVSFVGANVSIETSLFDKPRSKDGNERLIQQVVTIPDDIMGYVGFHGSEMNVFDLLDAKVRDNFNRTQATDWGTASDKTTWTGSGGASSNYAVANNKGTIAPTSTNTVYSQFNSRLEYDHDVVFKVSPSLTAAGAAHHAYAFLRRTASNNYYQFDVGFTTGGNIDLNIRKNVAGSFTTLQTAASVMAYSANGTYNVRAQIRGVKLRMKIWANTAAEPLTWNLTHTSDTSITAAGSFALACQRDTSNTNSALVMSFSQVDNFISLQARYSNGSWSTGPYRTAVLRRSNELQKTWTCTSGFTWDGTNNALGWSGEILLTGIGRHRNGANQGSMYVTCPKDVTNYVLPVFGAATPTTIAVHANGVVLAAGRSLWVAVPPGERNVDLIEHLFIVDSGSDGVEFQLPEWAVLIAHRQPGTQLIRLGNGEWAGAEAVEVVTTDSATFTSTSYVATSTGLAQCGVAFIAPQSGKVSIEWSAEPSATASFTLVSIEVKDGATVGSGTGVFGPDDNYTARNDNANPIGSYARKNITGLTPGMPYNVRTMHRRGTATNGDVGRRKIWVTPIA